MSPAVQEFVERFPIPSLIEGSPNKLLNREIHWNALGWRKHFFGMESWPRFILPKGEHPCRQARRSPSRDFSEGITTISGSRSTLQGGTRKKFPRIRRDDRGEIALKTMYDIATHLLSTHAPKGHEDERGFCGLLATILNHEAINFLREARYSPESSRGTTSSARPRRYAV